MLLPARWLAARSAWSFSAATAPPCLLHSFGKLFASLADSDLVLGPTEDGGYYLIGCRRFDPGLPGLFDNVAWSTAQVFAQPQANAERLGYRIAVLPPWFDLDAWKDVERLLAEARQGIALPPHLRAFLEDLG